MTLPDDFLDHSLPVKYFLNSYRALSDGRSGVKHLDAIVAEDKFFLSEWKVAWIGTCAILRTAIELFKVDAKSCINMRLRDAVKQEWAAINSQKTEHPLFWQFLREERNNIMHQYEWRAYAAWLNSEGKIVPRLSLISMSSSDRIPVIVMSSGFYEGRNSVEVMHEAADWVEDRIFSAIRGAGYDPDEERKVRDFTARERTLAGPGLLTVLGS